MTKVLITDPIDKKGIDILSQVAQVDQRIGISNSELASIINEYDALMIRSGTQVTEAVINSSKKLSINLWAENVPAQLSRHYAEFTV